MIWKGTPVVVVAMSLCSIAAAQEAPPTSPIIPSGDGWIAPRRKTPNELLPNGQVHNGQTTAPVSSTTGGFLNNIPSFPAYGGYPAYGGGGGYPGGNPGGGGGGGGGGAGSQAFPNAELTFPTEKDARSNPPSKPGASSSSTTTGSGAAARPSKTPPSQLSVDRDDSPGLPGASEKPATPVKKPYTEGHVVLFLRSPGDEDPSPKGVLARYSREAKIVKRLAPDVAKGDKPVTKPEDSVLRDPAPQGFYLPDEIDAWLVTPEGAIVLLESENALFDRIAALALSARLNVVGAETQVPLDPSVGPVTKVKVAGLTLDGSEPKAEPSSSGSSVGTGQERG